MQGSGKCGKGVGRSKGEGEPAGGRKEIRKAGGGSQKSPPVPFSREPRAFSQQLGWVIPGMRLALTGPAGPAES